MSRDDLTADLLADLAPKVETAPATPSPEPVPLPAEQQELTPAVSVHWTPLRWTRPRLVRASDGAGKALRVGPIQVELTVKD